MSVELLTVPYGLAAAQSLRAAVAGGKQGDPLAPVSVVVPTNYVGVAARRMLGSGALGEVTDRGVGIAGVTFLTVYRVAEMLGAPRLAAARRRPVSTPVLSAAVRGALDREPGMFAAVARHPATEQALVAAYRELSQCDDTALDRLTRASKRAAEVVRVYRAARMALAKEWYDERDLMDTAVIAVHDGSPVLADLGALVLYLPQDLTMPGAALLRAVADHASLTVVAGVTGVERADAGIATLIARLGIDVDGSPGTAMVARTGSVDPPHGTEVVSASDPDHARADADAAVTPHGTEVVSASDPDHAGADADAAVTPHGTEVVSASDPDHAGADADAAVTPHGTEVVSASDPDHAGADADAAVTPHGTEVVSASDPDHAGADADAAVTPHGTEVVSASDPDHAGADADAAVTPHGTEVVSASDPDHAGADADAAVTPHGTEVVSASDPDDEVRAAVRLVMAALLDGVPLERMALLYGAAEPYARLVHEQLEAAGIPHNGAAVRTLAESVLGRSLLGLLALPDRDFHRHDVMALLAGAPVWFRGHAVPSARWERISRRAGVVRGATQWHERLVRHAGALDAELAEELAVPDREPRPDWYVHERDAVRDLDAFVTELRDALAAGARPGVSWRELSSWARQLLREFLAHDGRRAAWPEVEQHAADKVEAALDRLAGLDSVEPAPGLEVFRRTLELELDADLGRVGHLGHGILMGHVALGLGLDLDRVFVCGLAEGTFPARVRDDSLLPDADRRATEGVLGLRASRVDDDHRRLLAALAAARDTRVLLFPRGDLRRTTDRMPSRFLLDTVEALTGTRHYGDDLLRLDARWLRQIPSFAAGVARVPFPATEQEHRLRALLEHTRQRGDIATSALCDTDTVLARGLECELARASSAFTRFDGNLGGLPVPSPAGADAVVSPTRLEHWAISPFDYLMEHILRVEIPELPEEVWELSPLDRGSLVHDTLDEFLGEVLTRPGGPPAPGTAWTDADRARLHEIANQQCARYEALGLTGRRAFWDRDRRRILADLDRFLAEDAKLRAAHGLTPLATELRFGLPEADWPAIELELSDGRQLRFRGAADRVDGSATGSLLVVDYKTGRSFTVGEAGDPTSAGTKLQLPVYALAAKSAFGVEDTPVVAAYWFVSARGDFRWAEVALDDVTQTRFDDVLRVIVDGIENGVFPCSLDPPDTWQRRWRTYADPDTRGTRDRYREWVRKRGSPELAAYVALAEPDESESEERVEVEVE